MNNFERLENARATGVEILKAIGEDADVSFGFGGSCWVWDGQEPYNDGGWRLFLNRWAVDPAAIGCLDIAKVEAVRRQAQSLVNAFPQTMIALERVGCDHAGIVDSPIVDEAGVIDWAHSIWNACLPLPTGVPSIDEYPLAVCATVALTRPGFAVVHPDVDGHVAVLPVDGKNARVYWASPGTTYSRKVGTLLGPRHPVAVAAYRPKEHDA